MTTVRDIVKRIEDFAPKYLAEDWDPIGLAFGSMDKPVKKILVALDLDADTLKEAKEKGIDLIFTHHPPIFGSLKTLNEEDERRKEYIDLIRSDIALYAAHTNIDAAEDGMNDWLAKAIGLSDEAEIIEVTHEEGYKKIAVYVPEYASEHVRAAMHDAGAGEVGDYADVSYTLEGYGRFTPQEGSDPAEGEIGKTETVKEERIEMMVPEKLTRKVIQAINESHPYEEPVFDVFTLEDKGKAYGYGRVGELAITSEALIDRMKKAFSVEGVRLVTNDPQKEYTRVAIFGGSGGKYYPSALAKGADVFITGDISYHAAQDMLRDGIDVIDPGHYIENIFVEKMTEKLKQWSDEESWSIEVNASTAQTDMFRFK